jgi:NAD(P)-dependent dehydrogenase (short-subunit alcohol dehydrogenase family)
MATEALEGKVTVVTGAAVGMGAATARVFGEAGAKVLVADVDEEKGGQTAEAITAAGGTASFLRVDVSRVADVEATVATGLVMSTLVSGVERRGGYGDAALASPALTSAAWTMMSTQVSRSMVPVLTIRS